jgi:hypothetical protein
MARGGIESPIQFPWSQSIAAGALFNPLDGWDYETPDTDVAVEIFHRATAVGLVAVVKTGGFAIGQEGPVPAGGTAGVPPGRLNLDPITGRGFSSRKLSVNYRNPTGGAIVVDGYIVATPIAGGRRMGAPAAPPRRAPPRRRGRR